MLHVVNCDSKRETPMVWQKCVRQLWQWKENVLKRKKKNWKNLNMCSVVATWLLNDISGIYF